MKPVYQQMTLSPWLGVDILWHIRLPLLTLIFISVAFSPQTIRDWNALPENPGRFGLGLFRPGRFGLGHLGRVVLANFWGGSFRPK